MQARSLCVVLTHNYLPPPRKKLRIERCPLLPFTAHVLTDRPPPTSPGNSFGAMLQSYFRSGWAFLIPYLAAYLLYAWLRWPVNPVAAGSSPVDGGQLAVSAIGALPSTAWSSPPFTFTLTSLVPPLLHVYWFLHALHLVLGALALRAWWRESGATVTGATDDSENTANHSATPQPLVSPKSDVGGSTDSPSTVHRAAKPLLSTVPQSGHRLPLPGDWPGQTPGWQQPATAINRPPSAMDRLWAAMPWLLLALLFYIPGVYLEWPSDPWEHLRRINEWQILDQVTAHSSWTKSSYFLPYSLTGHTTGLAQLTWLNLYYTGVCLLLSWQYYRLARAIGLGERASFIFFLINAFTFGNNIFSFYRYYGLSSSILAQIGAVALTRVALEMLGTSNGGLKTYPLLATHYSLVRSGGAGLALLPVIAFNHLQGLGIAGLGTLAVIVWRLIEWRRSMIFWLAGVAGALSIAMVLWFPRHPTLDEVYRPQGWLTAWYGFDFFSPTSPTFDRSLQVLGIFGILNVVISIWLAVRNNHIVGWLSIMPVLALSLPCFAIPLVHVLAGTESEGIIIFHRFLFAIPAGFALVTTLARILPATPLKESPSSFSAAAWPLQTGHYNQLCSIALAGVLLIIITVPPGASAYNHFWHSMYSAPADLQLRHLAASGPTSMVAKTEDQYALLINTALEAEVYESFLPTPYLKVHFFRWATIPDAANIWANYRASHDAKMQLKHIRRHLMWLPEIYTPTSLAGYLSGHWARQQVALDHAREY